MADPRRLIFVVTEDWYFHSHRQPMIRAAQDCGFDVSVITNVKDHRSAIEALGVKVIPFSFERRSLNPFKAIAQIAALRSIYARESPAIVHHIAMKPVLFGSVAAAFTSVPCVINAFAGLGYVYSARTALACALKVALWPAFFLLLRRRNSWTLFQNDDDRATLQRSGLIVPERSAVIRGSGVDLAAYPVSPLPDRASGFICAYAGRMIGIKGLPTLRAAFALLDKEAPDIRLHLYGSPDAENPGAWDEAQLREWDASSDNVAYKGRSGNMAAVWAAVHLALQPSYGGEGIPKSLLEAASCGRAIVASDVPGCREVVRDGENGFLVRSYDARALADAIKRIAGDNEMCKFMGEKSRTIVEDGLSSERVRETTFAFYRRCLADFPEK